MSENTGNTAPDRCFVVRQPEPSLHVQGKSKASVSPGKQYGKARRRGARLVSEQGELIVFIVFSATIVFVYSLWLYWLHWLLHDY